MSEKYKASAGRFVLMAVALALAWCLRLTAAPVADPPLITAAKNGQLASVQALLKTAENVNEVDSYGYTPIMWAFSRGNAVMVQALLARGAAIPSYTPSFTPLIEAAKAGQTDVVQLLLTNHANINARDSTHMTALMWAVGSNRAAAAALLIKSGANLNLRDSHGKTALMTAAQLGQTPMVVLLASAPGIKINERDRFGYTALMWAAHGGHADAVAALMSHGADAAIKGKDGLSASAIAQNRGYAALAATLKTGS